MIIKLYDYITKEIHHMHLDKCSVHMYTIYIYIAFELLLICTYIQNSSHNKRQENSALCTITNKLKLNTPKFKLAFIDLV